MQEAASGASLLQFTEIKPCKFTPAAVSSSYLSESYQAATCHLYASAKKKRKPGEAAAQGPPSVTITDQEAEKPCTTTKHINQSLSSKEKKTRYGGPGGPAQGWRAGNA